MEKQLLELPAKILLDKFGAGEHVPGSGSAAVFQGLLSAQLIHTVINLTTDTKHRHLYSEHINDLLKVDDEITNRIYPELLYLFQKDSDLFDKVINLRKERDTESNLQKKTKLDGEAKNALIPATETIIKIAELGVELAEFGALIFDHGFQSARGDSGVAMSSAISAIGGCLSIIQLNLRSFTPIEWVKNIKTKVNILRSEYDNLLIEYKYRLDNQQNELARIAEYNSQINLFKNKNSINAHISNADIEKLSIKLQRIIWEYRDVIWKKNTPQNPLEILNPEKVIKIIGYIFNKQTTLGQHSVNGNIFEVAGLIDNQANEILISEQFPLEIQRFTSAHELGHALLHKQRVLHRDRALDGSFDSGRDKTEFQADKFATYFLMPKKQVIKIFSWLFLTDRFVINDSTAFALISGTASELEKECNDLRKLSRKLASSEYYNGNRFTSMAKQFDVSVEAMAIRLEELELLELKRRSP